MVKSSNINSFFWALLLFLTFTPSVTFSLLHAEVFPYAFLVAILLMLRKSASNLSGFTFIIPKKIIPFLILIAFSIIYGFIRNQSENSDVVRSVIAYLNPILIFFAIFKASEHKFNLYSRSLRYILYLLLYIGLLQFSGVGSLIGLDVIIKLLIPRGDGELLGLGRGASLLSSEPSRASLEFIFISLTFRYLTLQLSKVKDLFFDFLILLFLVAVIRSATGVLYFLVYFAFKQVVLTIGFFVILASFMSVILLFFSSVEIRALEVISIVLNTPVDELYKLFLNVSGFRGISVHSSYLFGFSHLFGGGVGFWQNSSLEALKSSGFLYHEISYFAHRYSDFVAVRPTSYMASLTLDIGVFGLIIILSILSTVLVKPLIKSNFYPVIFLFLFYLFFIGSIGNPVPWICIALLIRNYNTGNHSKFVVK